MMSIGVVLAAWHHNLKTCIPGGRLQSTFVNGNGVKTVDMSVPTDEQTMRKGRGVLLKIGVPRTLLDLMMRNHGYEP